MTPADLAGLTVTPPADSDADFTLTVSATATEADGDTATTLANLDVTVTGVADVPTVTVAPATGAEDTAIPLDITAALADTDGSETLGITIAAVPLGAILSAGTDNGDGTWTLTGAELFGLTITPPAESADDFTLGITVTATDEGGETATTTASIDVAVTAVADAPTLDLDSSAAGAQLEDTVQGTAGDEIPLDMSAGLTDTDLSETLSITISGAPEGATLSAGFDNGDGSWTLTGDDLAGLTITSPDAADFELSVSATATEAEGDTATTTGTIIGVSVDTGLPTEGDDVVHGTPAGDVIDGLGGNDLIFGEAGNDTLTGGTGSDFVSGGEGDDILDYSVDGEWGGNAGALNVETGETVSLDGLNQSTDVFDGGTGDDVLRLTDGDDAIFLDDRYSVFPQNEGPRVVGVETIDAGAGDDLVDLTSLDYDYGDVTINGGTGDDILWSSSGNDTIDGGAGDDQLFGGGGNDFLIGGEGENEIDGGAGIDMVDYSAATSDMKIDLDDGEAETDDNDTIEDELRNVENVVGSAFDDEIKGDDAANVLAGGAGDDRLKGEGGADTLLGGLGSDHLDGGKGDDALFGGDGADKLHGNSGSDVLWGEAGDDELKGGSGTDTLFGGTGDDELKGESGDDVLWGDFGDDVLKGGSGDDRLSGGAGDDKLEGGKGTDTADFSDDTAGVTVDLATGQAIGSLTGTDELKDIENVTGGSGDDLITGSNKANVLDGGDGNDTSLAVAVPTQSSAARAKISCTAAPAAIHSCTNRRPRAVIGSWILKADRTPWRFQPRPLLSITTRKPGQSIPASLKSMPISIPLRSPATPPSCSIATPAICTTTRAALPKAIRWWRTLKTQSSTRTTSKSCNRRQPRKSALLGHTRAFFGALDSVEPPALLVQGKEGQVMQDELRRDHIGNLVVHNLWLSITSVLSAR